jgi:O-antigen/teichoic acid export membrane protein
MDELRENPLVPIAEPASERQSSGWDVSNAPRNYIWLLLYQFGSSAFAFAAVWLITRKLGPEGYGGVFAVIAASQIVQIFTNWTTVAVVRFGVDEFVAGGAIARTFWSRFVILIANLFLLLAGTSLWFPFLADWLKLTPDLLWLVIAHFVISAFWMHIQMGMQAAKMLRGQGMLQMFERLIIFAGVAWLYFSGTIDVRSAVICYIAGSTLMMLVGVVQLRSVIFRRFTLDGEIFKKTLVYSLPLLPYWFVGFLSGSYVDAAFITKFLSKADLGVYSIATQVNGIAMQVPTIANTILLPLLLTQEAETQGERSFHFFRHILPPLVLAWGVACAVLASLGYVFIPLVFKPEFSGASQPLWILLAGSVFWVPIAVGYAAFANATSATYMSLITSVSSAVINIGANIYLIPRYGLIGCAWATLLAFSASAIIFAVLLNRRSLMPYSWMFIAFVPSVIGATVISFFDLPLWALAGCIASSLVIAVFKRRSIGEMYLFLNTLRRAA